MISIELSQGKIATVSDEDYHIVEPYTWSATNIGNTWYAVTRIRQPDDTYKMKYMHRMIMENLVDLQPGEVIDHINGNGINNQRYNIRRCSISDNLRNRHHGKWGSQYPGVYPTPSGKWCTKLWNKMEQRLIHLGTFELETEAYREFLLSDAEYKRDLAIWEQERLQEKLVAVPLTSESVPTMGGIEDAAVRHI